MNSNAKTSDLSDITDLVQVCNIPLQDFGRRKWFSGAIRTIKCDATYPVIAKTLSTPGKGCVLVVDGGGSVSTALLGDRMVENAVRNGWEGIIVFGAVRDSRELDSMEIGIKALAVNSKRGSPTADGKVDSIVHFGGIDFIPGSLLVADEDGVIVLPHGQTIETLTNNNQDLPSTGSHYTE